LADLLKDYRKLTKGLALQVNQLDQGASILKGIVDVIESYFSDEKVKKDQKQSEPLKELLGIAKKVHSDVQSRRLDKGRSEEVKDNAKAAKVTKHNPADNVTVFSRLGMLLGSQVEDGKKVEFEIELEIPLGGQTLDAKLAAEAEYESGEEETDPGKYKVRAQISAGTGIKFPGIAKISATLGGYVEAQATDARLAGDLLGYALYRRLAESDIVPAEVQYYLFGTAGRDGKESSEANMAYIEQLAFGEGASDDNYAESGGVLEIEAAASGKLNPMKGASGSIAGTVGTRTDKKSLAMNNMQAGGKKGKESGLVSALSLGSRGAEKSTGRTIGGVDAKIAFKQKPIDVEGEYSVRWINDGADDKGKTIVGVDTNELGFTLTFPESAHDAFDKVKTVTEMIVNLVQGHAAVAEAQSKQDKGKAFTEEVMGPLLGQAGGLIGDKMKESATKSATKAAYAAAKANGTDLKGAVKAGMKAVGYKSEESKAIAVTIDFTEGSVDVEFVEVEEQSIDLFGLKATMKKTSSEGYNLREGKGDEEEEK
jgi:hypothetical protein